MSYRQTGYRPGYNHVGNWTWEFYPPPYDFLAPFPAAPQLPPVLHGGLSGLAGCHCGGTCGGCSTPQPHPSAGLGLFDSGFDLTQWTLADWIAAGVGSYLVLSLFGDLSRAGGSARKAYRRRKSTSRRREELQQELRGLG